MMASLLLSVLAIQTITYLINTIGASTIDSLVLIFFHPSLCSSANLSVLAMASVYQTPEPSVANGSRTTASEARSNST